MVQDSNSEVQMVGRQGQEQGKDTKTGPLDRTETTEMLYSGSQGELALSFENCC